MAAKKTAAKKNGNGKVDVRDVVAGNRTLEGVLMELAERARINDERWAVHQDLVAITQEMRAFNERIDGPQAQRESHENCAG